MSKTKVLWEAEGSPDEVLAQAERDIRPGGKLAKVLTRKGAVMSVKYPKKLKKFLVTAIESGISRTSSIEVEAESKEALEARIEKNGVIDLSVGQDNWDDGDLDFDEVEYEVESIREI